MRIRHATLSIAALLTVLCALPTAADTVAKIENTGKALVFRPIIEARAVTLTVSGPCDYRSEIVRKRGELAFELGEDTFDGSYSYSLVASPILDRVVREALLKAREGGDNRAVRELCREGRLPDAEKLTQTGSFTVHKGRIIFEASPESEDGGRREDG